MSDKMELNDHIDEFTKNFAQASAQVNNLTAGDSFKYVNHNDMSALLWAIGDRLESMKIAFDQIIKAKI